MVKQLHHRRPKLGKHRKENKRSRKRKKNRKGKRKTRGRQKLQKVLGGLVKGERGGGEQGGGHVENISSRKITIINNYYSQGGWRSWRGRGQSQGKVIKRHCCMLTIAVLKTSLCLYVCNHMLKHVLCLCMQSNAETHLFLSNAATYLMDHCLNRTWPDHKYRWPEYKYSVYTIYALV